MKKNWIMFIGVTLTTILIVSSIFLLLVFVPVESQVEIPIAEVISIDAATSTPIFLATWIPTQTPEVLEINGKVEQFQINGYVQISGTDGEGLRIRSGAGRNFSVNFIGLDSELFKIIEGPIESDDYIWWHIEAPYDNSRNGWCVQNYLSQVETP